MSVNIEYVEYVKGMSQKLDTFLQNEDWLIFVEHLAHTLPLLGFTGPEETRAGHQVGVCTGP